MLRPRPFLDQNDPETYLRLAEFSLGDSLLVCPITQPGVDGRWMYLPRGEWYYYWTDEFKTGGQEVWAAADLTRIPLFVKAGAVLPLQPVMQYVGEKPVEELTLHVYYINGTAESLLYDDGGEGYAYQEQGQQTLRRFLVSGDADSLSITQTIEGPYQPSYGRYRLVLHGLPGAVSSALIDGQAAGEIAASEATTAPPLPLSFVVAADYKTVELALK